jgi:monofunctional biosynthetic peptidoglycan transglycosylase
LVAPQAPCPGARFPAQKVPALELAVITAAGRCRCRLPGFDLAGLGGLSAWPDSALAVYPGLRAGTSAAKRLAATALASGCHRQDSDEHEGVDLEALKEAMEYNLSQQRLAYGASTLSQQTVKNLFLSPSRNPLRKWHELVLTLAMERSLSKRRILEYYLNVAEFGRGIYGVDAAARFYWNVPVSRITARESIELAATLPSPVANNPSSNTRAFRKRVDKIRRYFRR